MKIQKVHEQLAAAINLRIFMGVESLRAVLVYFDEDSSRSNDPEEKIYGLLSIARKLSSKGEKAATIKRTQRMLRQYSIYCWKEGKKIVVYRRDIELFKQQTLIGKSAIAEFLEISTKTLSRWLKSKKYTKIPVKRAKTIYARRNALRRWNIIRVARKLRIPL